MHRTLKLLENRIGRLEATNRVLLAAIGLCLAVFLSAAATIPEIL